MANLIREEVLEVHHWTERLFSFTTSRSQGLRFKNGHFTMVGLECEGRPLLRAYSIASANYEEQLEFFSIKVPDGPLTSRLQHIQTGDEVLISTKPTGTLVTDHLLPGKRLYLLATGTGLAPFISIVKDPEVYEQFDQVILVHGVRQVEDLAYRQLITEELPANEYFGADVQQKLKYYPTVTREPFVNQGRITDLLDSGRLVSDLGMPAPDPSEDRFMLCGSPEMLRDTVAILAGWDFRETRQGIPGHFAIERAFVGSSG